MNKIILYFLIFITGIVHCHASLMDILGQVINSSSHSYGIINLIGDGDKSLVFLAQNEVGDFVAIKRMYTKKELSHCFSKEQLDLMFFETGASRTAEKEYQISQQLACPQTLKIAEFFYEVDNKCVLRTYLVMEFIAGNTLRATQPQTYTFYQAHCQSLQFIDTLKIAYKQGLIHDDLHSTNVMFDEQCQIKLIDLESFYGFNASRYQTHLKYVKDIIGTLYEILVCGDISSCELERIRQDIRCVLDKSKWAVFMNSPLGMDSVVVFDELMGDITLCLETSLSSIKYT